MCELSPSHPFDQAVCGVFDNCKICLPDHVRAHFSKPLQFASQSILQLTTTINSTAVHSCRAYSSIPCAVNINQLVLKLEPYVVQLEKSGGVIAEFVNPKYADATRTAFKSSTRLECMMQDYPKELPPTASVGFTVINQVRPLPALHGCHHSFEA